MAGRILYKIVPRTISCNKTYNYTSLRLLLSSAYPCPESWAARLEAPLIAKAKPMDLVLKIQDKLDREGTVSPIDVDILANRLNEIDPEQMDFVQTLFKRFRHCQASLESLDSTPYAIVRGLLGAGQIHRLIEILKDKVEYGLFLDPHAANLLLDYCIENKQIQCGADVAFDQMLQEDFSHPLTHALSWWACHQYWKNPPDLQPAEDEAQDDEMHYIPVKFIERPYYDDHFDLPSDALRLGKTLEMLSRGRYDVLGNSYRVLGWAHYEKFEEGLASLREILERGEPASLAKEALDSFRDLLDYVVPTEAPEEKDDLGLLTMQDLYPYITAEQKQNYITQLEDLLPQLESSPVLTSDPLEPLLNALVTSAVTKHQDADIRHQMELYTQWQEQRQQRFDDEMTAFRVARKKEALAEKLLELQAKDEKLRYFEQLEKVNLGISRRPRQRIIEEVKEEEQFVAAPGERGRGKG